MCFYYLTGVVRKIRYDLHVLFFLQFSTFCGANVNDAEGENCLDHNWLNCPIGDFNFHLSVRGMIKPLKTQVVLT